MPSLAGRSRTAAPWRLQMSRLPNIPPASGDPASRRPKAMMVQAPTQPAAPAAPAAPMAAAPKREVQPAQVPLNLSDNTETTSDENHDLLIAEFLKETHTLP